MAGDFVGWVRSQNKRKDQIGDLARELVSNPIAPKKGGLPTLRRHFQFFGIDFESALAQAKSEYDKRPAEEVKKEQDEQNLRRMERAMKLPQLIGTPKDVDEVRPRRPDIIMAVLKRSHDYTFYVDTLRESDKMSTSDWMAWQGIFARQDQLGIMKEKRAAWWLEHINTPADTIIREWLGSLATSFPDVPTPTTEEVAARRQKTFERFQNRRGK